MVVKLLNIPNFYSTYYLLGLYKEYRLQFEADTRFIKFNNLPILIFQINGKIAVIDNDDPVGVVQELYEVCELYFVTNKLKNTASYNQKKVRSLFPHFPVNVIAIYIRVFGFELLRYLNLKELVRQIYIQWRRPYYKGVVFAKITDKFVFFSSNIWKKEPHANAIRAEFIRFCSKDPRISFEGGFVSRSDKNNLGFEDVVNKVVYSPKTFSRLSSKSLIALNNPAVCDAVSWRLADYLNQGLFVVSFPFKIELPKDFVDQQNIYFINSTEEYGKVLNTILIDTEFHEKISRNGKDYFDTYCTPRAQAKYIIEQLLKNN
ncbi:hypothetical protein [Flavobacterium xanthum]|uniref:Glycosyltransferase family 1 protein n=1 Tax=Flavobacterium xanthum TaxID=69322 RepID=A0A1M7KI90_9FLAO|nr:hypothetical protein [Flavobacterium xanthum]SHM65050.1 hypothetical protein SAMN05443669_105316 [Flavobacterium xanthum]